MVKFKATTLFMLLFLGLLFQVPLKVNSQTPPEENNIPLEQKFYGLTNFWASAKTHFAFFDQVPDLNWEQAYVDYAKELLTVENDLEYYRLMQRFAAELNESHAYITIPRSMVNYLNATPGLHLDLIEDQAVVVSVTESLKSEVPIGAIIKEVDGMDIEMYLKSNVYPYIPAATESWKKVIAVQGSPFLGVGLLYGAPDTEVTLSILQPGSTDASKIHLKRQSIDALKTSVWVKAERKTPPPFRFKMLEDDIAHVMINSFRTSESRDQFESILPEIRKAKAVILDIRKNEGGNSGYGLDIGKYFFTESVIPLKWKSRQTISAFAAWGLFSNNEEYKNHRNGNAWFERDEFHKVEPADKPITTPIGVLIGIDTFSAGENFAAYMKSNPRAVFLGSKTAGSTGQPYMIGLPGGGQAAVTAKRDYMVDGTEFVGYGIEPDIKVYNTVASLIEGQDLVLQRAIEELKKKIN